MLSGRTGRSIRQMPGACYCRIGASQSSHPCALSGGGGAFLTPRANQKGRKVNFFLTLRVHSSYDLVHLFVLYSVLSDHGTRPPGDWRLVLWGRGKGHKTSRKRTRNKE